MTEIRGNDDDSPYFLYANQVHCLYAVAMKRTVMGCLAAVLLSGCNVEIDMPAGGAVSSSSGLYACAALETCQLVIDHPYFRETFTAVPTQGYLFSHWSEAPGSFCRGSSEPQCSELDTTLFQNNEQPLDWLSHDNQFYLTPVFVEAEQQAPLTEPVWHINSTHQVVNYEIDGDTPEEILQALNSDANPLHISASSGGKAIGYSKPAFAWNYTVHSDDNEEFCEVASGDLSITYTTTIPQLLNAEDKAEELQSGWQAFQANVVEHEVGHQRINRSYNHELPDLFAAVGEVRCEDLSTAINAAYNNWAVDIIAAQDNYHLETGSGTSFWIYFEQSE